MIEEYARYTGHADLLRESLDDQVGAICLVRDRQLKHGSVDVFYSQG